MFPLYDTARSHKFPLINLLLIVTNTLAYLYELQMGPHALRSFIFTWGLIPALFLHDPTHTWITILTSMFLHGGWFHILSNMWVLFIFGDNVEAHLGRMPYLIFYILSGTSAGLLQSYILPASQVPMIGASGSIAGVLGAYLVLFPHSRIASLVPLFFIFTLVEVPAYLFLLFWFASQLYSGWFAIQGGGASGIAWWAHVGGFTFRFVIVFLSGKR